MTTEKQCSVCRLIKPLGDFYNRKADVTSRCKACKKILMKEYFKEYHKNNRTKKRMVSAIWNTANKERSRLYRLANKDKRKPYQSSGPLRWPERIVARRRVMCAVRSGRLVRQPCRICGDLPVEAHHIDYSRPLEVEWLCQSHHSAWHKLFITEDSNVQEENLCPSNF